MSRTSKVLFAVMVILVLLFTIASVTATSAEPQIIQVTLNDYQINMSQFVVTPGKAVTVVVTNVGESPHKLVVLPYVDATTVRIAESPVIGPHTTQPIQFTLEPGVYRIECVQSDHTERGMVNVMTAQTAPQKSLPLPINSLIPILGLVLGTAYIIADSLGLRLTK